MITRPVPKTSTGSIPAIDLSLYASFDGTTDDTANLQGVINGLGASGGLRKLVAPYGKTALLTAGLDFSKANLIVEDLGVKLAAGVAGTNFNIFNVLADNIHFLRPIINGNSTLNNTKVIHGIGNPAATPVSGLKIIDGTILYITAFGIFILNSSATTGNRWAEIRGNYIQDVGAAAIWGQALVDSSITDNTCISAGWHAMGLQPGSGGVHSSKVLVHENNVTKATPPSVFWPGTLSAETGFLFSAGSGVDWLTISLNIFWDNRNSGPFMDGVSIGNTGASPIGLIISNNTVGYTSGFGIAANYGAVIEGNKTYKTANAGIGVEASTAWNSTISHVDILGNVIIDPFEGGLAGKKYDAAIIVAAMSAGCTLTDINIVDNDVYDTRATKYTNFGASVDNTYSATVQDVCVKDNNFRGVNTGAVEVLGTPANYSNIQVKNNDSPMPFLALTPNQTTVSVIGGDTFQTANTVATSIANFSNGYKGQEFALMIGDTYSSIVNTGNIVLSGGASSLSCASGDIIKFYYDGTVYRQMGAAGGSSSIDGGTFNEIYAYTANIDAGAF